MPTPLLPDPVLVCHTALLAQPAITALFGTNRVLFALPATWPKDVNGVDQYILLLSLVDDDEIRPETLFARVQGDVYGRGGSKQDVIDSKAAAATVRSVARDLNGDWPNGKIRACVAGQIIPNPDEAGGRARHVVDLTFQLNA